MSQRLAKKVLLIGWDAADWKVITPLMDAGKMPALETIVNAGVIGNLATLNPPLSPMMWTSIATGMRADKHGILGFTEPDPERKAVRPVSCRSRKVKAVWNILTQKGMKTNVVGWWPSHPAEPVNGVYVSNYYHRAHTPLDKPWPMAPGVVHPKRLEKTLADLRVHPGELTEAHILPFVPNAGEIDQDKDTRLASLGKIIAECSSVHAAATWIMENEEWDFMGIYYDAIDHFSHAFMNFHPPRMEGVPEDLFEMYKGVVEGGYRFHDMMLGRLLTLAGPDTTVILVSDHGFHSDHLRPKGIPHEPAGPAVQHRPLGIIAMKGPHIKKDERVYGATLLDITPTVLTLFGLPVGGDMDGHALVQAFDDPVKPDVIESWEKVEGECGMHAPDVQQDPFAEQAVMEQMVALGYIEPPDENRERHIQKTVTEAEYNLARVHMDARHYHKALPILEKLYKDDPSARRFAFYLAKCYQILGRLPECRRVVEAIVEHERDKAEAFAEEMRKKAEEREAGTAAQGDAAEDEATPPEDETEEERKARLKEEDERRKRRDFVSKAQLDLLQGSLCMAEGEFDNALQFLLNAEKADPRLPTLHQQIGRVYSQMKRWNDAERAYMKALEIDPDSAEAHHGLAVTYLRRKRFTEAASEALRAVGIIHHSPFAHYHLGVALIRLGQRDRAVQAFEIALSMRPGMVRAHRWLALIYGRQGDTEWSNKHLEAAKALLGKGI